MSKTTTKTISIKVCGPAGSGILQLGELLANSFNKAGLHALVYPEYESRIRGGDNNIQIVVSTDPYLSPRGNVDVLFSIGSGLSKKHSGDLDKDGISLESGELGIDRIEEVKENPLVLNSTIAGFLWSLFYDNSDLLLGQIRVSFGGKIADLNVIAAEKGFAFDKNKRGIFDLEKKSKKLLSATGNQIFAQASLKAGVEYVSIYPMTPITSLLETLSKVKIVLVQPEDEIFAALSTLGASYAGKRALTATSGGGFCLMSEAVGFSAMAEIPMVIILGQRTGPSSGIPTYSSQSDLDFSIFSGNGEGPKIVLAPGDLCEISLMTQQAFNLADRFQVPVIILTDKYLSETRFSVEEHILGEINVPIDKGEQYLKSERNYQRYSVKKNGVSARALPGDVTFVTNSYEHDESGYSTDDARVRVTMNAKRMRKLSKLKGGFEIYGNKSSRKVVIGWGSTKTILLDFIKTQTSVKYIHINRPWPFPDGLKDQLSGSDKVLVVENNSTGQMSKLIKRQCGTDSVSILKDDGRPFFKEEIDDLLRSNL